MVKVPLTQDLQFNKFKTALATAPIKYRIAHFSSFSARGLTVEP